MNSGCSSRWRASALLAWCAMLALAGAASAQSTAQISGTVRDQSGGVLPGTDVTVTQIDTGFTRSLVTGADGFYTFPSLPLGPYRLDVMLSGFQPYSQTGITLQVGGDIVINVSLGVSQIAETVSVTASMAATPRS
jgi:hypothetical protein